MQPLPQDRVSGLFVGKLEPLLPSGQLSGINKQPQPQIEIRPEGVLGDRQADRRNHGGLEKAVHQFSHSGYRTLRAWLSAHSDRLRSGVVGENLTTEQWDEHLICIGDRVRLGTALLQVSQPRTPCWKLAEHLETPGLARRVQSTGATGWYYRVLEPGTVAIGDNAQLVERVQGNPTIAAFWALVNAPSPPPDSLDRVAACPDLALDWKHRLKARSRWLRANGGPAASPGSGADY
ncbi:MAG: MOSC domain-containing protein [Pseudomonadota bacterium]|nr:MOSC domain-containing protein [Pseudomonadota bacterium]